MSAFWIIVFFVNWLINILMVEFLAIRKLKSVINVNEERDQKFKAFRRNDVWWFNRPWLYLTCHFTLMKLIFVFSQLFVVSVICRILTVGHDMKKPFTGIHYWALRANFYYGSRMLLWGAASILWIFNERPKVCYKKYLGEDWVPDYDDKHCGSTVSNHCAFLDSMLHGLRQYPCIIAKQEVRNIPFIGPISDAAGNIHIDRSSINSKRSI